MVQLYAGNPRHSKAATILSIMSDDMVADVVDLIQSRGNSVIADLSSDRARGLSPLAIFSRNLIADEDFREVWVGFNVLQVASMRSLKSDFDFYESTLRNAFGLPSEMASQLAKTIETYDIIGVTKPGEPVPAWNVAIGERMAEQIRKLANWSMDILHLPFENDQDQKYDIDFLYELRLLGKATEELNSRARLMSSQAAISAGMGLFKAGDSGDAYSSPEGQAAMVGDIFSPLLLSSLPKKVFGQFDPIAKMGRLASTAKAKMATTAAGLSTVVPTSIAAINNIDPGLNDAIKAAMTGQFGPLTALVNKMGAPAATSLMNGLKAVIPGFAGGGDISAAIGDVYGEEVGDAWAMGDLPGVLSSIGDLAASDYSTGDAELDEQIIGDVLADLAATGDLDYGDAEIGGIIKRARINAALRKGNRIKKSTAKAVARKQKKVNEDAQLRAAQDRVTKLKAARPETLERVRPARPAPEFFEEEESSFDTEFDPESGWNEEEDGYDATDFSQFPG